MENQIITIARQYGSGGREIGEKLAERLGYAYYDTLLLERVSQDSGLTRSVVEQYDEQVLDKWLNLSFSGLQKDPAHLPVPMRVAFSQFEAILKIAQAESAVIVGRCADYVLRDQSNVLSAFVHADLSVRVSRIMERNGIDEAKARKMIKNTDKHRAAFYNCYTDQIWGQPDSYNLCIDSGALGIDGAVEILYACAKLFSGKG